MKNLANKYRPKVFEDLVGQDIISKTLLNAIKSRKVHHSYLFYGPRGCGKTSTARIMAKSLNCHKSLDSNPCNECISCVEINNGNSIDVIEIDAASHTQVQNIREVIIDNVNLSPSRDRYRIYILDEVHMLSTSAFNALLKTLEEPPDHAIFIMATTEIHKVPLTIISRCQSFRFRPIPYDVMVKRLVQICELEKIDYDIKALEMIVKSSGGAMRDALMIVEKVSSFSQNKITVENVRDILGYPSQDIINLLSKALLERNVGAIHNQFKRIYDEGIDVVSVMRELRDYFANLFLGANDIIKIELPGDYNPFLFSKLSRKINRIIDEIKYSDNPLLLAETFLYTIIDNIDLEAIFKKIDGVNYQTQSPANNFQSTTDETKKAVKDDLSISGIWKSVLDFVSKENIPLYNILLSSDVNINKDNILITARNDFEFDLINKNIKLIEESLKDKYKIVVSKKKVDIQPSMIDLNVSKDREDVSMVKFKDIDNGEVKFPEFDKIKKVFSNDIVKVVKSNK